MAKISACVIVKNEEDNLPRWLQVVKSLADELIVVDTGSADRTVELASAAGAKVFHFAWINDFSKAKNFALEKAGGDWIVFLDADEYFTGEGCRQVLEMIAAYDRQQDILGFVSPWINIDQDRGGAYRNAGVQIRVFRNLQELRYAGAVHERLLYKGMGQKTMQYIPELKIYHTGYSSNIIQSKARRNLEILLARREKEGEQPGDAAYLADCYYTLQDYTRTVQWGKKAVEQSLQAGGREVRTWGILLQSMSLSNLSHSELQKWAAKAEEHFPSLPDYRFLLGYDAWRRQDYQLAESYLLAGLRIYETAGKDSQVGGDETLGMLPQVYAYLAQLALWKKKADLSLEYVQRALQLNRYHEQAGKIYVRLLSELDDVAMIAGLNQIYDKDGDAGYVLNLLGAVHRPRVRLYYLKNSGQTIDESLLYLLAGKLAPAAASLTEEMDSLLRLGLETGKKQGDAADGLGALLPQYYREDRWTGADARVWRIKQKMKRMEEGK